jgi:hypothetical protein
MRKDLAQAHELAEEKRGLEYYKQVLLEFQEAKIADQEAKAARARAKKDKSKKVEQPEPEEDVEMPDADAQEGEESDEKKQKTKKRKAEDDASVSTLHNLGNPLREYPVLIISNRYLSARIPSRSPR